MEGPAFYAYAAPSPEGLGHQRVRPEAAHWDPQLQEFILMYDEVSQADNPEQVLLEFLQSTYESAAELAHWNRHDLEVGTKAA